MAANGEIDVASAVIQVVGDLTAGSSTANNQHRARRQLSRIAIGIGMHLEDIFRNTRARHRDYGQLIRACGNDNVGGLNGVLVSLE